MVWSVFAFEGGKGVLGTHSRLGELSMLPQGYSTFVKLTGLLNGGYAILHNLHR